MECVGKVAADFSSFPLSVEGTGCFPNPRRPRILWVGVGQGLQEMVALHDALEDPLFELGCYRRENRPYTPHITLGRTRTEQPIHELSAALTKYQSFKAGETVIGEVQVMSSQLTPAGPVYTILSRAKLH